VNGFVAIIWMDVLSRELVGTWAGQRRGFPSRSHYCTGVHADREQGGTTTSLSSSQSCWSKSKCDFDGQLAAAAGLPVPTGKVQFMKGSTVPGTVTLTNGSATLQSDFRLARFIPVEGHFSGQGQLSPQ